jgi:hypothetical protein
LTTGDIGTTSSEISGYFEADQERYGVLPNMKQNLRGPKNIPICMVIAENPGGSGHHWIAKRLYSSQCRGKCFTNSDLNDDGFMFRLHSPEMR